MLETRNENGIKTELRVEFATSFSAVTDESPKECKRISNGIKVGSLKQRAG